MTASEDRSCNLYNPKRGILIKSYPNIHNYDIMTIDLPTDNSKFVTGGGDKAVIVTDVVQGKPIKKLSGHSSRVNYVRCHPERGSNVILSAGYDMAVKIWDCKSPKPLIDTLKGFRDSVSQVDIIHETTIVCGSVDGSLWIFDIRMGLLSKDQLGANSIHRFQVSHSEQAYIVSCQNNSIYFIDRNTGQKLNEYVGHEVNKFTVDCLFSFNDSHVLTGSTNGELYIYDVLKRDPIRRIKAHSSVMSALDWNQETGLVTASHDGTVCFWEAK